MQTEIQKRAEWRISLLQNARQALSEPGKWLDKSEDADVSFSCPVLTRCDSAATAMVFAYRAKAEGRLEGFQRLRKEAYEVFPTEFAIQTAIAKYSQLLSKGGET